MSEVRPSTPEDELADDTILWRRVHPRLVKRDAQSVRPVSGVFLDANDEMSLHRASETDLATIRAGYPEFGVVEVTAGQLRALADLNVVSNPLENDASHALAKGKVKKSQAKKLAKAVTWVVEPEAQS